MRKKAKKWTSYSDEDIDYVLSNLFYVSIKQIARDIGRTECSIRNWLTRNRIKRTRRVPQCFTVAEAGKILQVNPSYVSRLRRWGRITPDMFADTKLYKPLYTDNQLRELVLTQQQLRKKTYPCLSCKQPVHGDLYCIRHLPCGYRIRPGYKGIESIKLQTDYKETIKRIGLVFKGIRHSRGLSQQAVSRKVLCDESTISRVECGRLKRFDLENLRMYFEALDCTVSIVIEKRSVR